MKPVHKFFLLTGAMLLSSITVSHAQINHAKTATVHVWGNCGMCETTIETSALKKNEAQADWNKQTKMAVITYDSTKTELKDVLKRIADAGYDNEMYTAPDKAYAKLHMCCQYERKPE